ncbi:SGNH/GDSL hydrolase family protein [Actinopolymorpha sp. NPDC004070]|uniref:SGNH/GDSL hydrolase family protein n=1 Tax=Actinopolymorpha sp. NPDC004070 TaxID=3154548 RepID=UPI0033A63160
MNVVRRRLRTLVVLLGFASGSVVFAAPAQAAPPTYAALGDSYSSGLGTRSYYPDSGSCYRSPYSYPVLDAARIGARLTFLACSGATVAGVRSQVGRIPSGATLVTVTAGGNDAGFGNVLLRCALPWPLTCWDQIDHANTVIRTVLPARLDGLYAAIRAAAPRARVLVVGYPRLFNGRECNLASRISSSEQRALNATADLLAATIAARAAAHGFAYADARGPFTGHSVCADAEWINGLSNPIAESYHPNRPGQRGYADLVGPALNRLAGSRRSRV